MGSSGNHQPRLFRGTRGVVGVILGATSLPWERRAGECVDASFNGRDSDYWANRHLPQAIRAVKSVPKAVAAPFKALR